MRTKPNRWVPGIVVLAMVCWTAMTAQAVSTHTETNYYNTFSSAASTNGWTPLGVGPQVGQLSADFVWLAGGGPGGNGCIQMWGYEASGDGLFYYTSPVITNNGLGVVTFSFDHQYWFKDIQFDGGTLNFYRNGVKAPVTGAMITSNPYNSTSSQNATYPNIPMWDSSSGAGSWHRVVANMGTFQPGDTLQVEFEAIWDRSYLDNPSWQVDNVQVVQNVQDYPILNMPPTNVTTSAACINGKLLTTDSSTAVFGLWGTSPGTGWAGWAHTNTLNAPVPTGTVSFALSSLSSDTTYYYMFADTNAAGQDLAPSTNSFITGALTMSSPDSICGVSYTDTAQIVVSRPGTCVAEAVTVVLACSGNATNGVDFATTWGNSSQISVVLPAGVSSVTCTIQPLPPWNRGASRSFTIALNNGPYAIAAPGNATLTLGTYINPALTMAGDWYIDTGDAYKLKRYSDNATILAPEPGDIYDGVPYVYK